MNFLVLLVHAAHAVLISSSMFEVSELLFPCNTPPFSINFLCGDRMVNLAGGSFPYLRLKFRWRCLPSSAMGFSSGVLIFINSTFAAKFKRFCLTPERLSASINAFLFLNTYKSHLTKLYHFVLPDFYYFIGSYTLTQFCDFEGVSCRENYSTT